MQASAARTDPLPGIATTCPYCGVGCGVLARPDGAGGAMVRGDPAHPANRGRLCSKGMALGQTLSLEGRLLRPEIGGVPVDWEVAVSAVAEGLAGTIRRNGPEAVAFYVSGQLLTEDYYVANKLMKGFLGSANIDTNSRLCMAASVAGHKRAFGSDTVPGIYEDIERADLVVLVGSNLAWCHPILFQRLSAARRRRPEMKLVVIDPRRTATAEEADLHLALRPGSDVALFNGLLTYLERGGYRDGGFVARHTAGLQTALAAAGMPARGIAEVAADCGLADSDLAGFFDLFARHERAVTVWSQGVNQSSAGADKVNAIVNCHLLTGRIGRPGMGPFSVTGQPNAMGGREVGALANQLAAHMDFSPANLDLVRRFWRAPGLATRPGMKAMELFQAVAEGRVKAIWIMATNPAVSMPDSEAVRRALEACPLVIVSDCMRQTDTTLWAHIRLPALTWGEKDGTVTNSERRISRQRPFLPPPGEAKPDWWILSQVARRLGFGAAFAYAGPAAVFREHAALSAFENDGRRGFDIGALADIDDAAYDALAPTRWPAPTGRPAAARLFGRGGFHTPDGRARFVPVTAAGPAHGTHGDYSLALNTGRLRDQWHTMTRTGKAPSLWLHAAEPAIEVHPSAAAAAGVEDGQLGRVESRWGFMVGRVRVTDAMRPGDVFAPMHWNDRFARDGRINAAVNPAVDPVSGQPELKHTPVRLLPLEVRWFGFALSRRPVALDRAAWWSASPVEGFWRYEIAGADGAEVPGIVERFRPLGPDAVDSLEFRDAGLGLHRCAWLSGERLAACVFIASRRDFPSRDWLASLFAAGRLSPAKRAGLLAGRPAPGAAAGGPVVCSCFAVGREAILAAAAAGAGSVEAVGAALRAGTNCGSCQAEIRGLLTAAGRPQ